MYVLNILVCLILCINITSETNLVEKLHQNISTAMSTMWSHWGAEKAVDLNENTDPEKYGHFSGTHNNNAWWRLNLQAMYPINKVYFIGRSDSKLLIHILVLFPHFSNVHSVLSLGRIYGVKWMVCIFLILW